MTEPFEAGSWGAWLARVDEEVRPLTPREYIHCERLLASWSGRSTRTELRAGLASLLARDPTEWEAIGRLFDEHARAVRAGDALARADRAGAGTEDPVVRSLPRAEPTPLKRIAGALRAGWVQIRETFVNLRRRWWLLIMIAPVVVYVVVYFMTLLPPPPEVDPPPPPVSQAPACDPHPPLRFPPVEGAYGPHPPLWVAPVERTCDPHPPRRVTAPRPVELLEPEQVRTLSLRAPEESDLALALLALLGGSLALLGFRCLGLLQSVPRRVREDVLVRERETDARRARAEEVLAERGGRLAMPYHFPTWLPVAEAVVLDSAGWLGRLSRSEPGRVLAPVATVERTVAAAGRFTPVMADANRRHELVLLIDVEQGDHPWLGGFRRVVDLWRRQGVRFVVHEFQSSPRFVVDPQTRRDVPLAALARRTEGLPLVVFSRRLSPFALGGARAPWLPDLSAWPVKAWIDPDPVPRERRPATRRRELDALAGVGLARFPLAGEGLLDMARWLASEGEGEPPASGDGGLTTATPAAREPALALWALAASLVPDPSWDQLEAIRRHFPEIRTVLERPQDLAWLLDWVAREIDGDPETRQGRVLNLPPEHQARWLREHRAAREAGRAPPDFEARARRLLLDQLGSAAPDDPYVAAWWRMKRDVHRAMLEPERARELLGELFDSALAREARLVVDAELERHEAGVGCGWGRAALESFARLSGRQRRLGVDVRELVWGERRLWGRSLARALAVLPLAALAAWGTSRLAGDRYAPDAVLPATWLLPAENESREIPTWLPPMVSLPGGTFRMGSEEGDSDELPVHEVTLDPFALSRTEVTVAQYARCVDAGECDEPSSGASCNWGAEPARDDHPVNCVSWEDAARFAGFAARWLPGARLPTEAEWEYAARDGGKDITYPWGDAEASCARAVILGCGSGTAPVCSKPSGSTSSGVCDLAGNVWEWVVDDYHGSYDGAPADGSAWVDDPRGALRVIRGGSFRFAPRLARAADRIRNEPGIRDASLGFRLSRSLPSEP